MQKVNILKTNNDGTQTTFVSCSLGENGVIFTGDQPLIDTLISSGIPCYKTHNTLYPKDGLPFLQELKMVFKSGYFNATDIITE